MRLLIATNGSPGSEAAVQMGAEIARHVDPLPTILNVIADPVQRAQADAILERASALLKPQGLEARTVVRVGRPSEEIVSEAAEGGYDLALVGESEHRALVRLLLGSTVQGVVAHAPCSVIVAKRQVGPLQRILLCDSGAHSLLLLDFTARLARLVEAEPEVTVLYVMSQISAGPGVLGKQLRANAQELIQEGAPEGELLAQDREILERLQVHPRLRVRHGLVVEEILDEAQGQGYDLIVIGAHRSEGWMSFLLDDLAQQIIEKVDRPVLVVK